jgi:VIT1/CCC1 family predicted Fe2+/Mn2+ transporter
MTSPLSRTQKAEQLRNFVFGVEDSLVSTVGLLSGIAVADMPRPLLLLTGTVLIFVEATSMAAGSFLSESSAREYAFKSRITSHRQPVANAFIMLASYALSGFVPLAPYLFISGPLAFPCSIGASLAALLALGVWGGSISGRSLWRAGIRMALIGGLAIGVGIGASNLVNAR